jgi:RHS repeat-associated protein
MGNRTMKLTKPRNTDGTYQGEENWIYTWYVRDAQGNVMCTYQQTLAFERSAPNGNIYREKLRAIEWPIYGSSRLGIHETHELDAEISASSFHSGGKDAEGKYIRKLYIAEEQQNGGGVGVGFVGGNGGFTPPNYRGKSKSFYAGLKKYELSNHLGNVMSVVTDRKTVKFNEVSWIGELVSGHTYQPDVVSATDYYPFGMTMPGRSFSSNAYRYGFNGMEKDDEVKGSGNSYTTYFRKYDPRLGRWLSPDPVHHTFESPYVAMHNNPISYNDPNGDCATCISGAIVGALVEFGGIMAEHIFIQGRTFSEGLSQLTVANAGQIALGASVGAALGWLDGGAGALAKFGLSPTGRKIIRELVEGGLDFIAGAANEFLKDGDITKDDVLQVLYEMGLGKILGGVNPLKKIDLVDKTMLDNAQNQLDRASELLIRKQKQGLSNVSEYLGDVNAAQKALKALNVQDVAGRAASGITTAAGSSIIRSEFSGPSGEKKKKSKPAKRKESSCHCTF